MVIAERFTEGRPAGALVSLQVAPAGQQRPFKARGVNNTVPREVA
jgi:hypothetical protein